MPSVTAKGNRSSTAKVREVQLRKAGTQIEGQHTLKPIEIPNNQRLIEAKVPPDRGNRLGSRTLTQNSFGKISGKCIHGQKDDNGNHKESDQSEAKALKYDLQNRRQVRNPLRLRTA